MRLCGWCEKRIWPWQHYGFRVMATGEARWHTACGAKVDRIARENQEQYAGWAAWKADESYEQFLSRIEGEE